FSGCSRNILSYKLQRIHSAELPECSTSTHILILWVAAETSSSFLDVAELVELGMVDVGASYAPTC
ncbi:hypothetical protein A2U01_0100517, partial [Trifolium medium]|nr:hypothetical protein [Trifolium medium]